MGSVGDGDDGRGEWWEMGKERVGDGTYTCTHVHVHVYIHACMLEPAGTE